MSASEESDVEMKTVANLPKKIKKKPPKSPSVEMLKENQEPKKLTTRTMIDQALIELKTRKGVSLYAIKKFLQERHNVDVEKLNYLIKKNIKSGVEAGEIVQMKGIGASGSFKLVAEKKPKKKKMKKPEKKSDKPKPAKKDGADKKEKKATDKKEKVAKTTKKSETKKVKSTKGTEKEKGVKNKEDDAKKTKKAKMAKMQTPAKKRAAMMKRKSIGSIIKPPKMKPKAKG